MGNRTRLLTILHASDLHIGEIDPVTGDAKYSPVFTKLIANFSWFDGVLGHHARGLEHLAAFYTKLQKEGEEPLMLVSGDLTRVGADAEFDTAVDYLRSQVDLHPPAGNYVGLHWKDWKDRTIPGNHDHWPGTAKIFGKPGAGFHSFFPLADLPYVLPDRPLPNGRVVQFMGIDTDRDVSPKGLKRLRAVGSFQSQLAALGGKLKTKTPEQIRVLLMHHSWHKRGVLLSIDRGSRGALDQFLVDQEISVILTGHTHVPLAQYFVPQNVAHPRTVLEGRSGTTTQNDQVPYNWRTMFGLFPSRTWPKNSLLVHRIYHDDAEGTVWQAETFTRTKKGFVSIGLTGMEELGV
jgi:3',5'-cyclic AMP phosphodiesterase CpdA